jgi:hypothetical protein
MPTETNLALVNNDEPTLSLDPVIGQLNEALRLFAEGDHTQACLHLAAANGVFDSCLACQIAPVLAAAIPCRSVAVEQVVEEAELATIA